LVENVPSGGADVRVETRRRRPWGSSEDPQGEAAVKGVDEEREREDVGSGWGRRLGFLPDPAETGIYTLHLGWMIHPPRRRIIRTFRTG
jgi:hypothetical protein